MSSTVTFRTSSGRDPEEYLLSLADEARPTSGDSLFAGQRQRTRILERTGAGVDVDGRPFAPYSTKGPYYHYPVRGVGGRTAATSKRKAATARLLGKVRKAGGSGGDRTPLGIKFEGGYAAFKRWLGRSGVDLRGPNAPHMLQSIIVQSDSGGRLEAGTDSPVPINSYRQPASQLRIGIYGEEAGRAIGHNTGDGNLPKRRFLGSSTTDRQGMVSDLLSRVVTRLRSMSRR